MGPPPPPSGWRESFDAGTGAPYWINIETGLSTDVRPTSPAGTVGTTSAQKQESPTVGSPGVWRERFDAGTGAPYWINTETGLSTDDRPTSPAGTVGTTSAQKQGSPTVGSPAPCL